MDNFSFLAFPLKDIPLVVLVLMVAFTFHEFAHAYVAYKFGDPTAQRQGRLTLSPLKHLDPFGTILIFLVGFGWAKPVPVMRSYFKKPRLAGVLVSIAGPISNLVIAAIGMAIWYALMKIGIDQYISANVYQTLYTFFNLLISLNVLLFVFNLLPFPPLDGYRIIEDLMPRTVRPKLSQFENYGALIFLIIIFTPLDRYIIQPIFNTVIPAVIYYLDTILAPLILF